MPYATRPLTAIFGAPERRLRLPVVPRCRREWRRRRREGDIRSVTRRSVADAPRSVMLGDRLLVGPTTTTWRRSASATMWGTMRAARSASQRHRGRRARSPYSSCRRSPGVRGTATAPTAVAPKRPSPLGEVRSRCDAVPSRRRRAREDRATARRRARALEREALVLVDQKLLCRGGARGRERHQEGGGVLPPHGAGPSTWRGATRGARGRSGASRRRRSRAACGAQGSGDTGGRTRRAGCTGASPTPPRRRASPAPEPRQDGHDQRELEAEPQPASTCFPGVVHAGRARRGDAVVARTRPPSKSMPGPRRC